jgi:hypothetical protein
VKVGIGNRVLPAPVKLKISVAVKQEQKRRERIEQKAAQISAAWVLRERLTKKFATDRWGVSAG